MGCFFARLSGLARADFACSSRSLTLCASAQRMHKGLGVDAVALEIFEGLRWLMRKATGVCFPQSVQKYMAILRFRYLTDGLVLLARGALIWWSCSPFLHAFHAWTHALYMPSEGTMSFFV